MSDEQEPGEAAGQAGADLFERVYDELKRIAHAHRVGHQGTLQTTGLVHEVYLRLAQADARVESEAHLLSLASRAMRQILVDAARRRAALKRGGDLRLVTLTEDPGVATPRQDLIEVLALEQSLTRLQSAEPRLAQVVELHCYGGLSFPEISRIMGLTERTLQRDWRVARASIQADLAGGAT